ncbi:REPLICATION PROTEIN A 70 KDA DNA-BINDING SUBUNIT B-RELATED [Salix koriyanagi]|uniref:REPLICATION PROTEIN A 70 kDa DNA-BINDING SUBUNIT B-RELATED n=1 Tax=Salix koriyanagi TaxID=2511006 RepID=A0A9Q0PGQ0_9ROSI|nr:REPLICATION PROTEIN A 70 KDA DNA-BINDING SUBUNIT B-RELATED [Salix koriyanagi]
MKIKAIFSSRLSSEILSGNIQNMSLIRVLDYTVNEIPSKSEKFLIITKCEVVSPEHEEQIRDEVKQEDSEMGMLSKKPKLENEYGPVCENGHDTESSPSCFIKSLPRQLDHKSQGHKQRKYAYLQECERRRGTQIQATMFNEAAKKFYDRFELGKVYYISKGTLRVANKQFKTVQNDYEMTLNENSEVEEASDEAACIPETKFNFVPIDQLGPYVNSKDLVDVIGIVQSVSPTMSIRRKSNNETVPKRDIVVADETKKTVVVSLWNELATTVGQELQDIADKSPVVAIKSLKVGDFQGISLSTLGKSIVQVNPVISESKKLRNWYDSEGKETSMASVGSGLSPSTKSGGRSMYSDRVSLAHITSNPSLGEDKNEYNNEKRQRITVRATAPVDFAAESKFLLEEISKMRASQ